VISVGDIYDKDVNFLIGSGASHGLFPTLGLGIRKDAEHSWTLEELATQFDLSGDPRYAPLFMHYYASCIHPAQTFTLQNAQQSALGKVVIENYSRFIETVLAMLHRRRALDRRCNVFTTNYDGCLPFVADEILRKSAADFVLNDGGRGFRQRVLQARNFNSFLCQTGVFDRHQSSVPQINLIHLHGSVYWKKVGSGIQIDYTGAATVPLLDAAALAKLQPFSATLANSAASLGDLIAPDFDASQVDAFWHSYKDIPIVNPTKWKFHETVYEEHYYQMLRLLSYELEKPNAVLIAFGFSFSDEHILNLVRRSLSNPHLKVYVCCFTEAARAILEPRFGGQRNVECISLENKELNFSEFNEQVFTLKEAVSAGAAAQSPNSTNAAAAPTTVTPVVNGNPTPSVTPVPVDLNVAAGGGST
jgi:hypothetical protein